MENKSGVVNNFYDIFEKWKSGVKNFSYENLVRYMYRPADPSSLGVIRFLFGLLMLIDIPEERGGSIIDIRWGQPQDCHFPLFSILKPVCFPCMAFIYGIMWLGAIGVMLGYKFRLSILMFGIPYWYILLIDKSYWNNHSYLFGLTTILLMGSSANHYLSVDSILDKSIRNTHVPYWNYFILKFQFFMLYFLAGLKKTNVEWLEGYAMSDLGTHWVFSPFRIIFTTEQIDYLIVHWGGFLLDLTVGFWMLIELTRPIAMIFCASFHLMNSRLFSIGMFPYVCLATMPLFCEETWPKKILSLFTKSNLEATPSISCIYPNEKTKEHKTHKLEMNITWKHRFVVALLLCHCGLQGFLPYSHFITKGYNNWTNGLYGYSWDMMIHSFDTVMVVVKVVDNKSGDEHFLDASAWTQSDRWNKHADMCVQYAQCIKQNLLSELRKGDESSTSAISSSNDAISNNITSDDISIYIDVWCSMNGRFQQRIFDPHYDLLKAKWSPFEPVEWLLPVLSEYNDLRKKMKEISEEVYSWSNHSDILFIADYPGLTLENYINEDISNVTLTVIEGEIFYEIEDELAEQSIGIKLYKGDTFPIEIGMFHKIHTISSVPSCYMYTYVNKYNESDETATSDSKFGMYSPFPLIENVQDRVEGTLTMFSHILNSIQYLLFGKPLKIRKPSIEH